jgi:hypothetical protein
VPWVAGARWPCSSATCWGAPSPPSSSSASQLASFFANGHGGHHGLASIRAVDTVWSSFPFSLDEAGQVQDANPLLLANHSIVTHPTFPLYLVAASALVVLFVRRAWMRAGLAGATAVALVAGAASAFLAKGPLYPYLVQ